MERTCLVTKQKKAEAALLRFTVVNGWLKFDAGLKAPGRGGYIVRDLAALQKLPKLAGKIAYFLRVKKVQISDEELENAQRLLIDN